MLVSLRRGSFGNSAIGLASSYFPLGANGLSVGIYIDLGISTVDAYSFLACLLASYYFDGPNYFDLFLPSLMSYDDYCGEVPPNLGLWFGYLLWDRS